MTLRNSTIDDNEYKGIRGVRSLFNQFDKDYYKPIKTISSFDNKSNYIEYKSEGDNKLSPKEYLNMIRPYLSDKTPMNLKVHSSDKVINYEAQVGQWKIQLAMRIDFISFKDSEKTRIMHANSDNVEIMIGSETDDIIDELFESHLQRYQERLEELMRESKFVFNNVDLL